MTFNINLDPRDYHYGHKYGRYSKPEKDYQEDGDRIFVQLVTGETTINIIDHWYSQATYESALSKAGFVDIKWYTCFLTDETADDAEYW